MRVSVKQKDTDTFFANLQILRKLHIWNNSDKFLAPQVEL